MSNGAKIWCFPDGYLPEKIGEGPLEAHEALMLLNTGKSEASVLIDIFFEDTDPILGIPVRIDAQRVKTLRLDHREDIGGHEIPPMTQYSLRVRSDVKIVVQFGRLDTTQTNLAYYGSMGYRE